MNFEFRLKIDRHSYFHAIWALAADFEISDNFYHNVYPFSTLESGYDLAGQGKTELRIQKFDEPSPAK